MVRDVIGGVDRGWMFVVGRLFGCLGYASEIVIKLDAI